MFEKRPFRFEFQVVILDFFNRDTDAENLASLETSRRFVFLTDCVGAIATDAKSVVEFALVLCHILRRAVMRGVVRSRTIPHEPRLGRICCPLITNHLNRIIGKAF